jgi:uncharacterized membrane protein YhaH (DUF805 family)
MTFQQSIQQCFKKYADFTGRANRSEYWWFVLFLFLAGLVLGVPNDNLSMLFSLVTVLPSIAAGCRRLHDTNKSGWFLLLWFIPVLGWIALFYLLAVDGDAAVNDYGEPPAN